MFLDLVILNYFPIRIHPHFPLDRYQLPLHSRARSCDEKASRQEKHRSHFRFKAKMSLLRSRFINRGCAQFGKSIRNHLKSAFAQVFTHPAECCKTLLLFPRGERSVLHRK